MLTIPNQSSVAKAFNELQKEVETNYKNLTNAINDVMQASLTNLQTHTSPLEKRIAALEARLAALEKK